VEANGHPLDALRDPTRRQVFELLRHGSRSVGELAAELPVSRPAVSQHLRVLELAGLVSHRRVGTRNLYAVNGNGVAELRVWVEGFWDEALARFKAAAESREQSKGEGT
jgi:DNA-binding transcriptional ArsR family regulator